MGTSMSRLLLADNILRNIPEVLRSVNDGTRYSVPSMDDRMTSASSESNGDRYSDEFEIKIELELESVIGELVSA